VFINAAKQFKCTNTQLTHTRSCSTPQPDLLLVPSRSKPDDIVVHEKTYQEVHLHDTYHVSASRSSATQSLVDHGANGGIGGSDVCDIYKTHHCVDVQCINIHQMIAMPIATVGGVIKTQQGGNDYQYAYTGLGTI